MNSDVPRVAFFADSFHEVNGVALTCRRIDSFARRRGHPFFSCHAGLRTQIIQEGSVTTCEFGTSALNVGLESDLRFDLLFARHLSRLSDAIRRFDPQLIHVTGPSHTGILGAIMAHRLKAPMVASWHTNIHEYGGRRLENLLRFLPTPLARNSGRWAERASLDMAVRFYRMARVLMAPNAELCRMLEERTGRECHLMPRGVDTEFFSPDHRTRSDDALVIGFVGRLSPEKNVRLLAQVDAALAYNGGGPFRICVIGGGSELDWLKENLPHGEFPGVLRGESLAQAYANLDLFAFPSRTDTYGNVIQEAMASGVPCVVTADGGPKFLVTEGVDGAIGNSDSDFVAAVARLAKDRVHLKEMGRAARARAFQASWDRVCEGVWQVYLEAASR